MTRLPALLLIAFCLSPAWADFPRLLIATEPVPATDVYVRGHGDADFVRRGGPTPVGLQLTPGTYDIRVEARDGLFHVYRGERSNLTPGFDRSTIKMTREVDWASIAIIGTMGFAAVVAVLSLWLMRTRKDHARYVDAVRQGRLTVADAELSDMELPAVIGVVLQGESGRTYRMESELGRGASGAVFEASGYAVKVLFERPDMARVVGRFEREIRLCVQLAHPNIVQIVDWGLHQSVDGKTYPFMVMEKVEGRRLREVLSSQPVSIEQAVEWTIEILRALRVAHENGIVHRDLKPDNVMIVHTGRVKVMDFGIAYQDGQHDLTLSGQAVGTPMYMSPEHLNAKHATGASDIYSVGVMLYEMLTGRFPHRGTELWALMAQKLADPPVPIQTVRADLDPKLGAIVMNMIATRPDQRYQTCAEVQTALEQWLA